ncbi:MAG: hypothetical protein H3C51_07055 [Rubellimicrobium sp.]|nr:hypothetical protein [Rubellimicrobium sp.]
MIFADDDPVDPAAALPWGAPADRRTLLAACADEARHLARALAGLDHALGRALASGAGPPAAAQALDRLRQEAEGLADVLALVAAGPADGRPPDSGDLARALRLHDQRARICPPPSQQPDTG